GHVWRSAAHSDLAPHAARSRPRQARRPARALRPGRCGVPWRGGPAPITGDRRAARAPRTTVPPRRQRPGRAVTGEAPSIGPLGGSMGLGAMTDRIGPERVVGVPLGEMTSLASASRRVPPGALLFAGPGARTAAHPYGPR